MLARLDRSTPARAAAARASRRGEVGGEDDASGSMAASAAAYGRCWSARRVDEALAFVSTAAVAVTVEPVT